jgi:septal ring factor EnvC (AmiA/AmiB activator)
MSDQPQGQPRGDGLGRYGSLGLAAMAAVISAAVSWGIYADRADHAAEQITALSNRMTTLALQIHTNAVALASLTERLAAERTSSVDIGARVRELTDDRHRHAAALADILARIRALEELDRRRQAR